MIGTQQAVMRVKQRSSKCAGVRTNNANGEDFDCGYGTTITCDDCKYSAAGGRKDPQAKCNQPTNKE